jgi:hypothetical protein
MGRLIPIFEPDADGRMIFEGQFRDDESGRVGHLEVTALGLPELRIVAAAAFVSEATERRKQ